MRYDNDIENKIINLHAVVVESNSTLDNKRRELSFTNVQILGKRSWLDKHEERYH